MNNAKIVTKRNNRTLGGIGHSIRMGLREVINIMTNLTAIPRHKEDTLQVIIIKLTTFNNYTAN